jgi:hypothetical protein
MQISINTLIMLARSGDQKASQTLTDWEAHEASHPGSSQVYREGSGYVVRSIIHPTPIYILNN